MLRSHILQRFGVAVSVVVVATAAPVANLPKRPHVTFRALSLTSPGVVRAPQEFALVGMSWPAAERAPKAVSVRTSRDGEHWTPWSPLEIDPDAGADTGATSATDPLWVGRAAFADIRWTGRIPRGAKVSFVDPGPDPAVPVARAEASPARPAIITRAQWGADESIRKCCTEYAEPLKMVMIHHTATGNNYSKADSARIVRSIYAYHVKGNGWNDIGYNFLVDRFGQIFEGRAGGIGRTIVGAHAKGFNRQTAGISVIGTFQTAKPPAAAMLSVQKLVAWRLDSAYIDPIGKVVMTSGGSPKWPAGQKVTLNRISGHRDTGDTACPGQGFYDALASLRMAVAWTGDPKLYSPSLSGPVITPNGDGYLDSTNLTARFSSAVTWKVEVRDPEGKVWKTTTGSGTGVATSWAGRSSAGSLAPHDAYRFRIYAKNSHGSTRTMDFAFKDWRYPNGTLFRTTSGWYGVLDQGKVRGFASSQTMASRYRTAEAVAVPEALKKAYPSGPDIGFRNGSVVRAAGSIWIISDNKRRPISSTTLQALGYDPGSIIDTSVASLKPTPSGDEVSTDRPNGTAIIGSDGSEGLMFGGDAWPFVTSDVRASYGIRDIDLAGPADDQIAQASLRSPVGFRNGSLVSQDGTDVVYVIENGKRRRISTQERFAALGFKKTNVWIVSGAELATNPLGPPI